MPRWEEERVPEVQAWVPALQPTGSLPCKSKKKLTSLLFISKGAQRRHSLGERPTWSLELCESVFFLSAYQLRRVSHYIVSTSMTNVQPWRQSWATEHHGAEAPTPRSHASVGFRVASVLQGARITGVDSNATPGAWSDSGMRAACSL